MIVIGELRLSDVCGRTGLCCLVGYVRFATPPLHMLIETENDGLQAYVVEIDGEILPVS